MRTIRLLFAAVTVFLSVFAYSLAAQPPVVGSIEPVSSERISILVGDKAKINLGTKDGLIRGDIGIVTSDVNMTPDQNLGECAVTRTDFGASTCELIRGKKEIESGNRIFFDSIAYGDPNFYSVVMTTLAEIVEPYEPYKDLRVCVYGVFDNTNAVTGLSQQLRAEFEAIMPQKKRIQLVSKDVFPGLILYPGLSSDLLTYLKGQMKRVNVDVLILAGHWIEEGRVKVKVQKIDRNGFDKTTTYALPLHANYTELNSRLVLSPSDMTKVRNIPCSLVLKSLPVLLAREDRGRLVNSESAGNALTQQTLRGIDFNMVNPVEPKAMIDGEVIDLSDKQHHSTMLSTGNHSLSVAFKRGFFYNETLLYTSGTVVTKDAVLSLAKDGNLVVEVDIDTAQQKDPIALHVYHPIERQRQILKPIYRVESERTVETFKD